jgi:hypothetical protein
LEEASMSEITSADDRLLSAAERDLVSATEAAALAGKSVAELQALGGRLREARDRARAIARRQQREMRGKAEPRATVPARDNAGSLGKAEILVLAVKRVTAALRRARAPSQGEIGRKALAAKRAAEVQHHPEAGPGAAKTPRPKASTKPTVRMDPREVGRVSQAGKRAQAKRDGR